jgi:hypothetical protein
VIDRKGTEGRTLLYVVSAGKKKKRKEEEMWFR